ncbi:NAD(P)-dependent alcohol dehydrogenase [Cellulomonas sp. NPDC057328]|uniref:NAD(P)-dependent alcohol dehydrogenase n=1 Tax=Cellulomonas sp. NPDC057328 TaxID=3346101 RepID=UPI0036446808
MRAVAYDRYGPPGVLRLVDLPVPEPAVGQVLVRVAATGVNLSDWECLTGAPAYARLGGLRAPARRVLGSDVVGRVAAVGPGAQTFAVGDEVYGDVLGLKGGFAEYALAPVTALAHRPEGLDVVQAAALPQPGAIAAHGVRHVRAGSRVLVNGGGGGSGVLAIQLAAQAGAHVTGVDAAAKLDLMRAAGADDVVDHRREDALRRRGAYDLVIDLVARRSPLACRRALAPGGWYEAVGGTVAALLGIATVGAAAGVLTGRRVGVAAVPTGPRAFGPVGARCAEGELTVHVERTYGLEDAPAALARVGAGAALGKLVVVLG